jgi:hypothetical protein
VIFLCDTQKKCGMCPEANLANLDDNYCLYVYSLYISQVAEVAWRLFKFLLLLQFVNINWLPEKECSGNSLAGRNIRSLRRYLSNRLKPESPQASSVCKLFTLSLRMCFFSNNIRLVLLCHLQLRNGLMIGH